MNKIRIENLAALQRMQRILGWPPEIEKPAVYPAVIVFTWHQDGAVFESMYVYETDLKDVDRATRAETLEKIIRTVAQVCDMEPETVTGISRHAAIMQARYIVTHHARRYVYTFKEIGGAINRTHKSVYNMLNSYAAAYKYEDEFRVLADSCTKALLAVGL